MQRDPQGMYCPGDPPATADRILRSWSDFGTNPGRIAPKAPLPSVLHKSRTQHLEITLDIPTVILLH